jgi:hypothetical protein
MTHALLFPSLPFQEPEQDQGSKFCEYIDKCFEYTNTFFSYIHFIYRVTQITTEDSYIYYSM